MQADQNPFQEIQSVSVSDVHDLKNEDIYFYEMAENGHVLKCKLESGVPVKVADLGGIKDFFNRAIMSASVMTPQTFLTADIGNMTHIEIAAMKMARAAALGDLDSTKELFDRVLGKSKQVTESTHLNLTIDDILNGVNIPVTPATSVTPDIDDIQNAEEELNE